MISLLLILLIVIMSFGVVHQAIDFPYEEWDWQSVRNIFYKPYFMMYGEVYAAEIDRNQIWLKK